MAKKNYGKTLGGEPITEELVEDLAAKAGLVQLGELGRSACPRSLHTKRARSPRGTCGVRRRRKSRVETSTPTKEHWIIGS